jgi:hypothetical protein
LHPGRIFLRCVERLAFNNLTVFCVHIVAQETQDPHLRTASVVAILRLVRRSFRRCRITSSRGQKGPSAHRQTRCTAGSWQLQQRCEASFSELCNSNRMIYKPACSGTLGSLFSTKLSTTSYVRAGPRCLSRPPLSPNFCLSTNTFRRRPIECRNMATLSAQRKHKVTVVGSGNWYVLHRLRRSKWQDVVMLQPSERS